MNYRAKYSYAMDADGHFTHTWSIVCAIGGAEIQAGMGNGHKRPWDLGGIAWCTGMLHFRQAPRRLLADPPSVDRCWLLDCPCWHTLVDGVEVNNFLLSMWDESLLAHGANQELDHEFIWRELSKRLQSF